jgi:hypothetical protein
MKRNVLFPLNVVLMSLLFTAQVLAQHQRLALAPQELNLDAGGSGQAEGFCLDRQLLAPTTATSYQSILTDPQKAKVWIGNAASISLKQAIQDGKLRIEASHLSIKFINATGQPVRIKLEEPTAFGEQQGTIPNLDMLAPLSKYKPGVDKKATQDSIWKANLGRSRLQSLGYLSQGNYRESAIQEALKSFQSRHGITPTGKLDASTESALEDAEFALLDQFSHIGFQETPDDTKVECVSDAIREYQRYQGMSETGAITKEVLDQVAQDAAVINRLKPILDQDLSAAEYMGRQIPGSKIIGLDIGSIKGEKIARVLVRSGKGPELWIISKKWVPVRASGERAVRFLSLSALEEAEEKSNKDIVILTSLAYHADGDVALGIGSASERAKVADIGRFINNTETLRALDRHLEDLKKDGGDKPRIVVKRNPLDQAGAARTLLGKDGFKTVDPEKLYHALQRTYGDRCDIVLANELDRAIENTQALPRVEKGSDIRILRDSKDFKDFGAVSDIEKELKDANIQVVKVGDPVPGKPQVVMVVGHKNENFRNKILNLAKQGEFKGSMLALASCGEPNETAFNSELLRISGAKGIVFFDQKINDTAVQSVLKQFAINLKQDGIADGNFQRAIRSCVTEVLKSCPDALKEEVKKLSDLLIQVSAVLPRDELRYLQRSSRLAS